MNDPMQIYGGGTIAELVFRAISKFPERLAFENDEASVSYADLGRAVSRISQHFEALGLVQGDTVAQLAVNRWEVFAMSVAAYASGLKSVTLHAMASEADQAYILDHCGASLVLVDNHYEARGLALRGLCTKVRVWLSTDGTEGLLQVIDKYQPRALTVRGDADTVVRVAYTGGTTGRSKGVMLSNRAMLTIAVLDLAVKGWPREVRYVCPAPISHGGGAIVVPTLVLGGCVTLLRGFSPDTFVNAVEKYRGNVTWFVPTMLYALLDSPRVRDVDWSSFHSLIYSGAPTSPARIRQALDVLGPVLVQSYGQTEAPNNVLLLDQYDHAHLTDEQLGAAGRPYPMVQVELLDEAGNVVPEGGRGEVCVRGPLVMTGYLHSEEETATALAEGWLHTGDVAYKGPDGLYYIVDRIKDVIISGGFNVYPKEIEDVLCAQSGVAAAAVIGVPDEKWGELVMAYVQPAPNVDLSSEQLAAAVRAAKGAVGTPKRVEIIDVLPQTAVGKIDKKALRARHWVAGARAVN